MDTTRDTFNLAIKNHQEGRLDVAQELYDQVLKINPNHSQALNNLGVIFKTLGEKQKAKDCYEKAIKINPNYQAAHNNLGNTLRELKKFDEAEISLKKAIELKPDYAEAYNNLGAVLHNVGRFSEAIDKYKQAIKLKPNYVEARRNLNTSTSRHVFPWHLRMMNDKFRNAKYLEAIKLAIEDVDDDSLILDIGTGSGLLSMMAAANGAGKVIACETSNIIADTAKKIIHKNGYKEKITVINKKSTELKIGEDLPRKADLIISEILSAEFVGEGVRTSVFDANKRLLKKNGKMIPESGTIKISLLGNDKEIFDTISVANVSGFDLSEFNSISQSKFTHFLKKKPTLLSNDEDAFSINLYNEENIEKEEKIIELKVNKEGLCLGIIQWMKIQLYKDIEYENSPSGYLDSSSHWPTPIYLFDKPVSVKKGDVLKIRASLDADNLWFFKE